MMKRNVLARKILCGLLAAGVVGACGSALAATYAPIIADGSTIEKTDDVINISANGDTGNLIKAYNGGKVNIYGKNLNFNLDSTADTSRVIYGVRLKAGLPQDIINLGNLSTESISVIGKGTKEVLGIALFGDYDNNGTIDGELMNIKTQKLTVDVSGSGDVRAIDVANYTYEPKCANVATLNVDADDIVINAKSDAGDAIGICAMSEGVINMKGNLVVNADKTITTRGNSVININTDDAHTTQLNGDISFDYHQSSSGTGINSFVDIHFVGEDSYFTGRVMKESDTYPLPEGKADVSDFSLKLADGAAWNMTGDSFVNNATVADGGSINVQDKVSKFNADNLVLNSGNLNVNGNEQEVDITDLTSNNGTINMQGSEQTITIVNALASDNTTINLQGNAQDINLTAMTGTGATVNTNSLDNSVNIGDKASETKIAVHGSSAITDQIATGKATLQDLANVVGNQESGSEISLASTVTSDANDIIGGYSAEVGENGKVVTQSVKTIENTTNRAISDMASISLMTWRQENNDMNKRLGELRDSKGEHGAWARMARGESKYGAQNVKNQYNYYQVGYDEKLSVNPNWTVGVALTRTEGSSTFAAGSGENKHTGVAFYGSYLADNGSFIDLIAKYARMDNDYKTIGAGVGDADYETNGYSISAEYGKRFTKANGFWIEPQVELTYGKVGSASYTTSKGALVNQDGIDSLVGRLGFSLGKDIKQGNVYLRASYLYDFDGETTAYMSKAGAGMAKFEQDLGGGWWEVGVGTNINLSDATHLYFDVEKTYGGNVATPWQWNAGVRWSF